MPSMTNPPEVVTRPEQVIVPPTRAHKQLEYVRFQPRYRVMHACMVLSFITLALTGLSLKFSYTGWAARLSRSLGGFETAGFIHRTAAVLMFTVFVAHLFDIVRTRKREGTSWGKMLFGKESLLLNGQDLREFIA